MYVLLVKCKNNEWWDHKTALILEITRDSETTLGQFLKSNLNHHEHDYLPQYNTFPMSIWRKGDCTHAKSLRWCPTLCNLMDYSPSGSSVQGILQARILEWVPCPSPGDLSSPGIEPISLTFPALPGRFFTT